MAGRKAPKPNIDAQIRAAFDALTGGQRKVAEFVLTHGNEAIYLSAADMAESVGVSHATVTRTAQALGFEGFPEFQRVLREQFLTRAGALARFQLGAEQMDSPQPAAGAPVSVLQRVMLADAAHIQTSLQQIPLADFDRAVEMLDTARRVFIIGLRASAPLALNLGFALRHIIPSCFILQPGLGDLPDQLAEIGPGDLLVAFSYGRYTRDTLRCMDWVRKAGAQILTITDSTLSPAAKRADLALVVPVHLWFYVMAAAPLSLISALVVAVALRHKKDAAVRLERLDEIFEQFQIFDRQAETDIVSQIERKR